MGTRFLLTTIGFAFLFAATAFASEQSLLARITVYWPGEGQLRACSNGARLRAGHVAVDPDAACVAVDSGPAVVSRKAARAVGHTVSQRSAIVIDRFFESKEAALSWERSHPHFMTVRVVSPGSGNAAKESSPEVAKSETQIAPLPEIKNLEPQVTGDGTELVGPVNPLVRAARRGVL